MGNNLQVIRRVIRFGLLMPLFRWLLVVFWPGNGSDVKIPDNEWVALVRGVMGLGGKYGFGPFEVRTGARELFENGTRVKLRGQPYLILEVLLERAGSVVTREEIRERLWPADTFVDFEHGLNTSVKKLRQVLCDSADEPRYIETVPRMGYRFIAPVEVLPGQANRRLKLRLSLRRFLSLPPELRTSPSRFR